MKIFFDVEQLYYLPQYLPVYEELSRRGIPCRFIFHRQEGFVDQTKQVIAREALPAVIVTDAEAVAEYRSNTPDWIVFGNACRYRDQLPAGTRTALLYHGIGVKSCYYDPALSEMDVRFVEGQYRLDELRKTSPEGTYVVTGFAKLDPLLSRNASISHIRKTILYAPTYYPSSIEMLHDDWPGAFEDCNIIIKPHFFTYGGSAYAGQRRKLEKWKRYPHVRVAGVEEYSLLPFMAEADILVSEASSALFEFAALDRPVVWLDFFRLRWTYRGPFRYRFTKRMDGTILSYADICAHAAKPRDMVSVIRAELEHPERYAEARKRRCADLLGELDGHAAKRIVDYLVDGAAGPQ